jgi:lipoprotein-anchoring transpeptidase ErfK/SrfK
MLHGIKKWFFVAFMVFALVVTQGSVVLAQSKPAQNQPAAPVTAKLPAPAKQVASAQGEGGEAASTVVKMAAGKIATVPPLPFRIPLVGPVIKHPPVNDVETRTRAFLPTAQALAKLSLLSKQPTDDKWIRVDLSEQLVVAYERNKPVRAFTISSGLPRTPTVTGEFRIITKVQSQTMSGGSPEYGGYSLPGVKWVQYFYSDYSFHGTYWHDDFGVPKSHGCLNMTNADAKWLFDFAGPTWDGKTVWFRSAKDNPGTLVIITD